jgi:hypothetical protein
MKLILQYGSVKAKTLYQSQFFLTNRRGAEETERREKCLTQAYFGEGIAKEQGFQHTVSIAM